MKELNVKCPKCNNYGLQYVSYSTKIFRQRSWLYCKPCGYQVDMNDFKKSLFCP